MYGMRFRNFNFEISVYKWVKCVYIRYIIYLYFNIIIRITAVVCGEHANSTDFTQLIKDFTEYLLYYYDKKTNSNIEHTNNKYYALYV